MPNGLPPDIEAIIVAGFVLIAALRLSAVLNVGEFGVGLFGDGGEFDVAIVDARGGSGGGIRLLPPPLPC